MSLRARLSLLSLLSVAIALTVVSLLVGSFVRTFLIGQLDRDLHQLTALTPLPPNLSEGADDVPTPDNSSPLASSDAAFNLSVLYVAIVDADGSIRFERVLGTDSASDDESVNGTNADASSYPALPSDLLDRSGTSFTVTGRHDSSARLRVAVGSASDEGFTTVSASSLADIDSVHRRVLIVEGLASVALLALLAALTWWSTGVGLRPLRRVEQVAESIRLAGLHTSAGSAGRSSSMPQRVPVTSTRTEVGQLATTFNGMLDALDEAFAARDRSDRRLRRFVADASHELRTPLTSIRGYSELARRCELDPPVVSKSLERIETESLRLEALVNDLLDLARLEDSKAVPTATAPVRPVIEGVVSDVYAAHANGPTPSISLTAADDLFVVGNPAHLTQVFRNLLNNALLHGSDDQSVEVIVRRDGDAVLTSVIDHGHGVPDEFKQQIFDRFSRLDSARIRSRGGAGLGLAIVKAIVESQGGSVTVTDTPGGGATFTVTLRYSATGTSEQG